MYYQVFEFDPVSTIDSLCYISMHGINAAFSLFEVFLTNAPPGPWRLLGLNLLLILGYVGIAYITRDTKGFNGTSFHYAMEAAANLEHRRYLPRRVPCHLVRVRGHSVCGASAYHDRPPMGNGQVGLDQSLRLQKRFPEGQHVDQRVYRSVINSQGQ